jgi:hypothetical protein
MLKLKFWKDSDTPDAIQVDLILRDGPETRAATVAVIRKRTRRWQDVEAGLPTVVRQEGKKAVTWEVTMTPPTVGASFDPDVFERPTLRAAKREIAARMFVSIVGCRDDVGTRRIA